MKKLYKAFLCTFCATALFSCVQEEFEPTDTVVPEGYTLQTFSVETQSTKTTVEINADGTHGNTLWAKGDQLAIFWDGGKGTADLKGEGGSTTGSFTGAVPQGKKVNYAVYPSKIASSVEGTTVNITIPDQQEGTFSAGNIAVAEVGEDNSISFNNLNAFLCIQLISEDITKITIESVGGEPLVGVIPVTFEENEGKRLAACGTVTQGVAKVTMTKAAGETGRYYVSIVPGVTHSEGLLMTYYKGEEVSGTYQLNQRLAPQANVIYNFGEFEPDFNYYVTRNGAGNKTGVTWRDAMPFAQMVEEVFEGPAWKDEATYSCKKVLDDKYNGATFHIEEGEYEIDEGWRALRYMNDERVTLTFRGGYDNETHKRDLENSKTEFTNKNGNNILDVDCNNDVCSDMDITFDGIGFVNAEMSGKNNAAIYSYCGNGDVSLTIKNCHFIGNTHLDEVDGSNGAALMIFSVKNVVIENTLFANNKAICAPAITIADTKATISNCRFEGNSASLNAGVMYVNSGAKPTFNDCVFTGNTALKWGMIHHQSGTTVLNNCIFTDNSVNSDWDGGAIATRYGSSGSITVNGGEFTENYAGWGAAFYQAKEGKSNVADLYVNDVLIKNNTMGGSGAVWADGKSVFTKCTFDANTAGGTAKSDGHALTVATGADMQLYGCTVMNHSSSNSSTAIVVRDGATLKIAQASDQTKSVIKNNTAAWGGAMALSGTGKAIISDTEFQENHAKGCGVLRIVENSSVSLTDCVFEDNYTTDGNGGAIAHESSGTVTCNRCHFEGNYAQNEGGAIKVDNGGSNLYLNACTFKGNYNQKQPAGTTIQVHTNNSFAMNNCTIADDTYSESNHASEPRISWLSFNEPQKVWMSNNTLIGVPRHNGSPTFGGLLRLWFDVDTDAHLVNNIVVTDDQDGAWSFCQLDKSWGQGTRASVTLHHTKYAAIENVSGTGNMLTYVESPTSSGFGRSSFGELTWDEGACCWTWNGTLTGGNNTNMISKDEFVSAINDAVPDFKSWLESNGELLLDQGGRYRGEDRWWPGAYQDGVIPAEDVTVTSFNIRGSNIDEDETSRMWANRKAGVFAWFNENQHPFVCAQECSEDQRNDILDNCSAYGAVYYAGSSSWWDQILGRDTDAPVVTFYKKDEVTVHSSGTFWLVDGAPTSPEKTSAQNQERCATWLKCTYKDKKMVVINTHISYRTKNGDTGTSEAMQALRDSEMGVIKTWVTNSSNYNPEVDGPVVLVGDFNTNLDNTVFTNWRHNNADDGFYNARDTMWDIDKDACDTGRTFNNWGTENGQLTIDHQFYKGFSSVSSYSVDREPYAGVTYLSDHWPLSVVYEF